MGNRPREIPEIEVKLEETANVMTNTPMVSKDFMSHIIRSDLSELNYTVLQDTYIKSIEKDSNSKTLKWLVYNLGEERAENPFMVLDGHLMLRPYVPRYPTTLDKSVKWEDSVNSGNVETGPKDYLIGLHYVRSGNLIEKK